MRIVVHGQEAFGKAVLERLLERNENVVAVCCAPDKAGRPEDPLKALATEKGIPLHFVDGGGNLSLDPLFVNPAARDYHLLPGSPCIDAGNNAAVPAGIETDLGGLPRFVDDLWMPNRSVPPVDMGAHEFQGGNSCRADFNNDAALNSQDFFDFLGAFFASDGAADFNADGFINSQDFFDFLGAFFAGCAG